jgi:hypothetical protein
MLFAPTPFKHRAMRVIVTWLLALVLPVQGTAVGIFAVIGPAHVHTTTQSPVVLEDFRRWRPAPAVQTHVFADWGHFHAGAAPQRHHHDVHDGSVVRTDVDDADEALDANVPAALALIPSVATYAPPRATGATAARPLWAMQTSFVEPLDRPPRRA